MRFFRLQYPLVLLLALLQLPVQSLAGGPDIGATAYRGYMWAHRKNMLAMEAPTMGFDLQFSWMTQEKDWNWAKAYRSPRVGVNLSYLDLGTDIAGKAFGVLPFVELKLMDRPQDEFNFRLSSGVGYLTQKWGFDNLKNKAIGSHFNANMRVHLVYHHVFKNKMELSALAGITHFSNANFRMPNLGVNSVELGIGLKRLKAGKPQQIGHFTPDPDARARRHEIKLSGATKETGLVYSKRIYVGIIGYRYHIYCRTKSSVYGGIDYFYDQGFAYGDNPQDVKEKPNLKTSSEVALTLAHDLLLGKWAIVTEGGLYAYAAEWNKGPVFQRVGFKYHFTPNWLASLTLKTHFARADYIEWGLAYTILEP
ncbi:MAG: acyloxyacyl hydrolase [Bacteroidota bacterium]|nr:acyloxyacyl hydrolase [Bacteroidota bacterium]MDX5431522.1 acyloxyacyl hydrolase [Bacteroidota bacterium]MDX5470243.1 acyloxyacyl hydrolase [Bacteroidota bacterium]